MESLSEVNLRSCNSTVKYRTMAPFYYENKELSYFTQLPAKLIEPC
jgi:hypothetical protein